MPAEFGQARPRRHLQPMFAALVLLTLALAGCSEEVVVQAEITGMDAESVVVQVQTRPGVIVEVESVRVRADAAGKATVTVPLRRFLEDARSADTSFVDVSVSERTLVTAYWGRQRVRLPFSPRKVKERAADQPAGLWLRLVDGEAKGGPRGLRVGGDFGEQVVSFSPAGFAELRLQAPPGATVEIDGVEVQCEDDGACARSFELRPLLRRWPTAALRSPSGGLGPVLPVLARMGGHPALRGSLKLRFVDLSAALGPELRAVTVGEPLLGRRGAAADEAAASLLYLDARGRVHALGPAETLRDVTQVAVAHHAGHHEVKACEGYRFAGSPEPVAVRRKAVAVQVTVFDASTGEAVRSQRFEGATGPCPTLSSPTRLIEDRPSQESVVAWLAEGLGRQ